MAQLYFRYSTMNAGKSLELIKVAHNYKERGMEVLCLSPKIDNRYGEGVITSRVGVQIPAVPIGPETDILTLFVEDIRNRVRSLENSISCVLVDEAQFLSEKQVEHLAYIVDRCSVPVIAYGLKNDFQNKLFEGSKWLLTYADKIEEIKTVCWCGRKATVTARVLDGEIVKEGPQIQIGGNESYVPLCRSHYMRGTLGPGASCGKSRGGV